MGNVGNELELSDVELVERIVAGEKKLYSILYERYFDKVYSKCLGMTHVEETAEDQTQEIFMKTLEAISSFKGEAKFSTWLYAITYNHCIEFLRKNNRIRFADWEELLEIPDDVNDHELAKILDLTSERLILLLEFLKPEDKAIIILKYWEGMDLERIKYILSFENVDIVKMRLYRARKRLRAIFRKFEKSF